MKESKREGEKDMRVERRSGGGGKRERKTIERSRKRERYGGRGEESVNW